MDPHDTKDIRPYEGFDTTESSFLMPHSDQVIVQYGAKTDPGKVRTRNEDHYVVIRGKRTRSILSSNVELPELEFPGDEAYTLIVADGAGGEGFGHLASQLAIRTAWESAKAANWLTRLSKADTEDLKEQIHSFARLIQQAFLSYTRQHPSVAGMATTWTCACVTQWDAVVAHVGDSRAYFGDAEHFKQITHDHTLAEELLRSGDSRFQRRGFPKRIDARVRRQRRRGDPGRASDPLERRRRRAVVQRRPDSCRQ